MSWKMNLHVVVLTTFAVLLSYTILLTNAITFHQSYPSDPVKKREQWKKQIWCFFVFYHLIFILQFFHQFLLLAGGASLLCPGKVRCRGIASPLPPWDGMLTFSVWQFRRQMPCLSCPYPSDRTPFDAPTKHAGSWIRSGQTWSSQSLLEKNESAHLDCLQSVSSHPHSGLS